MRYFHRHLLVASALSLLTLTPLFGAAFYLGREIRDWEKGTNYTWFDWRGLLWPAVPWVAIDFYLRDWVALGAMLRAVAAHVWFFVSFLAG